MRRLPDGGHSPTGAAQDTIDSPPAVTARSHLASFTPLPEVPFVAKPPLRFAVDLLTVIVQEEGQQCSPFKSPASVTMAACMAALGGSAAQRASMMRGLGHDSLDDFVRRFAAAVSFRPDDDAPAYMLSGANAVFATDRVSFATEFRDAIAHMQATIRNDYSTLAGATDEINAFLEALGRDWPRF